MLSPRQVTAIAEARRRMNREDWQDLTRRFTGITTPFSANSLRQATADLVNRDAAWILSEALEKSPQAAWTEIAAAMLTVDTIAGNGDSTADIIWTGPDNGRFPVRRIDQVLYDLIAAAKKRIMLVTFAAHRVPHLCEHLTQAVHRGVELTLIVESEGESEGQLTRDALAAFQNVPTNRARIYYWPAAKRERNQSGRPGKLHVKCALIDDAALIGSANLTDDAFNRNMELGLLIRAPSTVLALSDHFRELIHRGAVVRIQR